MNIQIDIFIVMTWLKIKNIVSLFIRIYNINMYEKNILEI